MDSFVYLVCLGVGVLFTLVSLFFGHLFGGGGHDAHVGGSGGLLRLRPGDDVVVELMPYDMTRGRIVRKR